VPIFDAAEAYRRSWLLGLPSPGHGFGRCGGLVRCLHLPCQRGQRLCPASRGCPSRARFEVWYDGYTLRIGSALRRTIDDGLAHSKFGIVVLSPAFFAKAWPQRELDGLVGREILEGQQLILPIWHKISQADVSRFSPPLIDKLARSTSTVSIEEIASEVAEVVRSRGTSDAR